MDPLLISPMLFAGFLALTVTFAAGLLFRDRRQARVAHSRERSRKRANP